MGDGPISMYGEFMEGLLERKRERDASGSRFPFRRWKTFYTVLRGHHLCFFKSPNIYIMEGKPDMKSSIAGARVWIPIEYTKRNNVFRVVLRDSASYLFEAIDEIDRGNWIAKINEASTISPPHPITVVRGPVDENGYMFPSTML